MQDSAPNPQWIQEVVETFHRYGNVARRGETVLDHETIKGCDTLLKFTGGLWDAFSREYPRCSTSFSDTQKAAAASKVVEALRTAYSAAESLEACFLEPQPTIPDYKSYHDWQAHSMGCETSWPGFAEWLGRAKAAMETLIHSINDLKEQNDWCRRTQGLE